MPVRMVKGIIEERRAVKVRTPHPGPTPHTLHPTPYTLHPTPYTLDTPYTPHPKVIIEERRAVKVRTLNPKGPEKFEGA
jgi:hypothetical protein